MPKLIWKKFLISKDILKNSKINLNNLKTYNKSIQINYFILNKLIQVYNGVQYIPININNIKLYYKLGNFIYTKKNKKNYKILIDKKLNL